MSSGKPSLAKENLFHEHQSWDVSEALEQLKIVEKRVR